MIVVYVAHPLGQGPDRETNRARASHWVAWVASLGYAPVADWIILSGEWDESKRDQGLAIDEELVARCDDLWLVGDRVSAGMLVEEAAAIKAGKTVVDLTVLRLHEPPTTEPDMGLALGRIARADAAPAAVTPAAVTPAPQMRCGACGAEPGTCTCVAKGVGVKYDADKPRYDLIDAAAQRALVDVITYGARKYVPNNWRSVGAWRDRYYAALLRHVEAWRSGEDVDPETGMRHLAHALCNAHFLCALDMAVPTNPRGQ